MKMNQLPKIEVNFIVEGNTFEVEAFTRELNVLPTMTRTKDDWPDAIKNNLNLPEELRPRCMWVINESADLCKQIEVPINGIISKLKGKEKKLLNLCEEYNLKTGLVITIHGEEMSLPEIVLSSIVVSYFGILGTEISFEIYTYCPQVE